MSMPPASPNGVLCFGLIEVINRVVIPRMPTAEQAAEVTEDYYRVGGSALNVALPLAVWGLEPVVVGNALGPDAYADLIWREMERHSAVQTKWLERDEHVRTPFTRIFVMPDQEKYQVHYWRSDCQWADLKPAMLAGVRFLSTDVIPGKASVAAARLARNHGLAVITSDVTDTDHALIPLSDVIVTSMTHLAQTRPGLGASALASGLLTSGAGMVVITNGSEPVQMFTPYTASLSVPSFPLPPVDRTGAGDVFKAGLLYGLMQNWELERSVRFGAAAASVWIALPTLMKRPPTLDEIRALLEKRQPTVVAPTYHPEAGEQVCPLCQRPVQAAVFARHWQMQPQVAETIRSHHPAWRRVDGACPRCIHAHQELAERENRPEMPLVEPGHPIYGRPDLFVLPTPVRLRANPRFTGRDVVVCFLDSGFYPHPDLTQPENRILETVDATNDAIITGVSFREPRLVSWHGLMTSTAAAGNGALSDGLYAGIARDARVVLVKISDTRGRVREADIARGLRWLVAHHADYGVQVVNLSVGGDRPGLNRKNEVDGLVKKLVDKGLTIVAAAGNAGEAQLAPPASALQAITVGGLDDQNVLDRAQYRMYWSNWGRTPEGGHKPEVIAPGIWLPAPVLPGTRVAEQNLLLDRLWRASDEELGALVSSTYQVLRVPPHVRNADLKEQRAWVRQKMIENKFITPYYQHVDGTSFSTPIVTSVVAQMLEANPSLSPDRVKELLMTTAERLPGIPEIRQGNGVVIPGRAVAAALRERYGSLATTPLSPYFHNHSVHFVYHDTVAQKVAVIGDFNNWNPDATLMHRDTSGQWQASISLPPAGRHHYKFVVDDDRWLDDPENGEKQADGFGGFNAILAL